MVDHAIMHVFKILYSVFSLLFSLSSIQKFYNRMYEEVNSFVCLWSVTSMINLRNITKIKNKALYNSNGSWKFPSSSILKFMFLSLAFFLIFSNVSEFDNKSIYLEWKTKQNTKTQNKKTKTNKTKYFTWHKT